MARYSETTKEMVIVKENESIEYHVEVEVTHIELRKGNYSSAALDPDEYYGEWATEVEVLGATRYDETVPEDQEEGYEVWLEEYELPSWVIDEAVSEYDY